MNTISKTKYDGALVDSQWPTDLLMCKVHTPVALKIGYPMLVDQVTSVINRHPSQDSIGLPWEVPLSDMRWLNTFGHSHVL